MLCQFCNLKKGVQKHHCFPNTKNNRKLYGKLLDMDFNIMMGCPDCHVSHAKIPPEYIWNESKFRIMLTLKGIELPEASKSYKNKIMFKGEQNVK